MDLLLASPASLLEIISGKAILAILIVPIQSFVWMLLLAMNWITINNPVQILLVVTLIAAVLVLSSTMIAVYFKDRGVAQLLYSLVLIFLFMSSYLFTNSPLNLVSRLSINSISAIESLTWIGIYLLLALVIYMATALVVRNDPDNI